MTKREKQIREQIWPYGVDEEIRFLLEQLDQARKERDKALEKIKKDRFYAYVRGHI